MSDGSKPCPGQISDPEAESSEVPSVLTKLSKWANYPAWGEPVTPTLFIPCKTPLSTTVLANWNLPEPPLHPLTVPRLLQHQHEQGRTVGLILDLSNVRHPFTTPSQCMVGLQLTIQPIWTDLTYHDHTHGMVSRECHI